MKRNDDRDEAAAGGGNAPGAPMTRRGLLRAITGGALAFGLGGGVSAALSGCSSGGTFPAGGGGAGTRLLVSTFLMGTVEAFDASTGTGLGNFAPSRGQGITTAGMVVDRNLGLFVFSPGGDAVFRYSLSGDDFLGNLATPPKGLTTPHNGVIGPDGMLYAVNAPSLNGNVGKGTDGIEKYDPVTGQYLGRFADIASPFGIIFGPDGDLYVSSTLVYAPDPPRSDYITRLDGASGVNLGVVLRELKVPFNMAWHPSGDLLVVEHFAGRVQRYDTATGALVGTFLQVPFPVGMTYGPDGDLYVGQFTTPDRLARLLQNDLAGALGGGKVLQYDGVTGAQKRVLIDNLPFAGYLAFV